MIVIVQFIEHFSVCYALLYFQILSYFVLISTLGDRYHYPHFIDGSMEILRGVSSPSKSTLKISYK